MESPRSVLEARRIKPQLSAEGIALLHAALEKATTSRSHEAASGLKHAVWRICVDARRNEWPPEQLLVAFKAALDRTPALQRLARGPDRDALVARLVSLCIEAYYLRPAGRAEGERVPLASGGVEHARQDISAT